jgi:2-polyprenyl-3-methyl-5-hydroxy-6-metoxy-1,4-benzoquinol methylase
MSPTYNPAIFDVNDIPQAMSIILTPEGSTTQQRWELETPYLADLMQQQLRLGPESLVLDYGCGIGRLSRELILRHGCCVVGVDISQNMRALSVIYARSDRFMCCAPEMLDEMAARGTRFDAALSVWVLQHCMDPAKEIGRMRAALRPGAPLFVANSFHRSIPTLEKGWVNDGLDIKAMLAAEFDPAEEGRLATERTTEVLAAVTYWATFRQRG